MNWPLFAVIYIIAGTVTTGIVIIGTLIMGFDEIAHMQIAVAAAPTATAICICAIAYANSGRSGCSGVYSHHHVLCQKNR